MEFFQVYCKSFIFLPLQSVFDFFADSPDKQYGKTQAAAKNGKEILHIGGKLIQKRPYKHYAEPAVTAVLKQYLIE